MIVRKIIIGVLASSLFLGLSSLFKNHKTSFLAFFNSRETTTVDTENDKNKSTIQVALLLDTSGSMSGLIEQAKSQLWTILNELARTERDGTDTELEIALYEYGNTSRARRHIQIHKLTDFTTDMDLISEKLFALTTDGGDEYCGAVIKTSLDELEWTNKDDLKIIYIAGNEPFTQGHVSYTSACNNAKGKGVTVNTIYCGDYQTGIKEYWQAGAIAGGGEYLHIDHNQETTYIQTPYDDQINQLNIQLNNTYIPFGKYGASKKESQKSQDANAQHYSSANSAERAVYKSSKKYRASTWDLVDAYKDDKSIVKKAKLLPDSLQNLTPNDLEARIQVISQQRASIQDQIQELDKKRRKYKAEKASTETESESNLQRSMLKSIEKQAKQKGYKIKR